MTQMTQMRINNIVRSTYVATALTIFVAELAIAKWVPGGTFVRDSLGDLLATAMLYYLLRGVTRRSPRTSATLAVTISFCVEGAQYLGLAARLGLPPGSPLAILIGTTFSAADLLMYTLGGALAFSLDRYLVRRACS